MASTKKTRRQLSRPPHDAADRDAQGIVDAGRPTPRAARGSSRVRISSATSSIMRSPIRATARTILAAARTGHLGPTIFRSTDRGRTWKEAAQPPAFEAGSGRTVDHSFWLAPGHASEPAVWYAGTSPQGPVPLDRRQARRGRASAGFNEHPQRKAWCGGDQDGTPDGPKLHSILVDPRDPRHLYIGMSSGGVFESTDGGADWTPLNKGVKALFLPEPDPPFGHDPHCVRLHPRDPDRLYQQNHCGIYRIDRPAERWTDIGAAMPKSVGPIGFPMVLHPRDPDTLWVFPMDGSDVWPRISPGGKPAVYRSVNGGKTWQRQATRPAEGAGMVDRQAAGNDGGSGADSGRLLRHDERRGLGQSRRRAKLEVPDRASCRTSMRSTCAKAPVKPDALCRR